MMREYSTHSAARPTRGKGREDGGRQAVAVTISKRVERRPANRKQGRAGNRSAARR
jgi:hypothetical protein